MDGVQRNFGMMAEKIDRMRCLRERCDNYVRLIKLTLDETIQEQNSLLDGSAIHNRLKYLGLIDKPYTPSNKFNNDKSYSKNIDSDYKYKYLVFDDHRGIRQHKKTANFSTNTPIDMDLSYDYDRYSSNYKLGARDFHSSTAYDDYNNPYYMPTSSKKYSKTMNIRTPDPREYQVYYFPTSKPIPQYPRHTTERFYRRKPVKQYPEEEVPYWPTRYPKPVRVVEREPSYPIHGYDYHRTNDYGGVGSTDIEPYTHRHRTRYFPANDMYHSYDTSNNYYYESDFRPRSAFSSVTRPCSPVYSRDPLYDRVFLEDSGSLLEKKIRDYVWNPSRDRVEKPTAPSYEKSTYYTDFKPLSYKHRDTYRTRASLSFDNQEQFLKDEVTKDNSYRRNSMMSQQEKPLSNDDNFQSLRDDDHFSECTSYKKNPETPVHLPKRISFDLDGENINKTNHTTSIGENTNENGIAKERKSMLGRRESVTKIEDKRRTSLLSNDDYSVSKPRVFSSDKNGNSRRESVSQQEKLTSIGNSFESDKYLNFKKKPQGKELNSFEKNAHNYNSDIKGTDSDHSNDSKAFTKYKDNKNNEKLKDIIPNGNTHHKLRRDSNADEKSKLMSTTDKPSFSYPDPIDNTSNKNDKVNAIKRRDSYKNEQHFKANENISGSKIKSNNVDNHVENEFNNYPNGLNETFKNIISPLVADHSNENNYNINQQETDDIQKYVTNNNDVDSKKNVEKIVQYSIDDDLNKEVDILQDSSDIKAITKEPEPSQDIITDEVKNNTDYYQDHYNDDTKEPLTNEYDESQPENVDEHVDSDEKYYPDEIVDTEKLIPNSDVEPVERNDIVDENNVHDEYYYENPTEDVKDSPTENKYEDPEPQENEIDKPPPPNDDYYYQNYSDVDPKEQPADKQYPEGGHQGEYVSEPNEHDDYYYQNSASDGAKEQELLQGDQQYAEPGYQGNYDDQQPTHDDDYYYQNYDGKAPPENQYAEPTDRGEYAATAEHVEHDDYYDQARPNESADENQPEPHYTEPEPHYTEPEPHYTEPEQHYTEPEQHYTEPPEQHAGDYADGEQSNYYYEDNPDAPPTDQYDEQARQESYVDPQRVSDSNYYDESIPPEQYDATAGYVGEQREADASYYPDPQANDYDAQQNYENGAYQAQPSEYVEPYDQNNPNSENYDYSDNVDESKTTK